MNPEIEERLKLLEDIIACLKKEDAVDALKKTALRYLLAMFAVLCVALACIIIFRRDVTPSPGPGPKVELTVTARNLLAAALEDYHNKRNGNTTADDAYESFILDASSVFKNDELRPVVPEAIPEMIMELPAIPDPPPEENITLETGQPCANGKCVPASPPKTVRASPRRPLFRLFR